MGNNRKIAKLIAGVLGVFEWTLGILALPLAVFIGVVLGVTFDLIRGIAVYTWLGTAPLFFWLAFVVTEKYKKRYLEKAGYGIKALEEMGAKVEIHSNMTSTALLTRRDRNVIVDIGLMHGAEGGTLDMGRVYYTHISVEHRGNIPCVVHGLALGQKRWFKKDEYLNWRRHHDLRKPIPKELKVQKELVPKVVEWVKPVLDNSTVAVLGGTIRIDPDNVLWWRRGGWHPPELLENAIDVFVSVAEKIEEIET